MRRSGSTWTGSSASTWSPIRNSSGKGWPSTISSLSDLANLCDAVGADVEKVRDGIGSDSRIGKTYLFPGLGYGGSCLPKDVKALLKKAQDAGGPPTLPPSGEESA